jgi:hypothetical protein
MSARPPSAYPNRRYSVATPANAIHENLFNICREVWEFSLQGDANNLLYVKRNASKIIYCGIQIISRELCYIGMAG